MVITPHMWTGAALGARAHGPLSAICLGVASHLALDRIPHTDYDIHTRAGKALLAADTACALSLLARAPRRAQLGALAAIAPDLYCVIAGRLAAHGVRLPTSWHDDNHTSALPSRTLGVATQVVATACALAALRANRGASRTRTLG